MSLERQRVVGQRMRTLVDLLNDDCGYVRIFAEASGFGYEKSAHRPTPFHDLFDRMSGYESVESALHAAQFQLQSIPAPRHRKSRVRQARSRTA